jgi:hypothetical protein
MNIKHAWWVYRRVIFLVQVLASRDPYSGIAHLCEAWEVEPGPNPSATIIRLARFTIDHAKSERNALAAYEDIRKP